jgi:hypothetical protein
MTGRDENPLGMFPAYRELAKRVREAAPMTERTIITETGCYLDNHRGHYITRDMIWLAEGYGFILGEMESFVLDQYDELNANENYPTESLYALADEALEWLNVGENTGVDRPIRGQNSPPAIPEGTSWGWNDGDFGLYEDEDEDY